MSERTKAIFWLTVLPFASISAGAAWASVYPHLWPENPASHFVLFKIHWLDVVLASAGIFVCGLTSLYLDRRNAGRK
jgi:hypothetical protein